MIEKSSLIFTFWKVLWNLLREILYKYMFCLCSGLLNHFSSKLENLSRFQEEVPGMTSGLHILLDLRSLFTD